MSLSFENISFRYNDRFSQNNLIFSNFSLHINKGEKIGIFGKTGTGKSTLVRLITGEEKLKKGKIIFQNQDIRKVKNLFESIIILFQRPEKQFVFPSIKDEIDFISQSNKGIETHSNIYDFANRFQFDIEHYQSRNIFTVSPGELKIIQIISVLSQKKPYLIFDDPFLFLDEAQIKVFKKILSNYDNTILIFARNQVGFEELINREVIL